MLTVHIETSNAAFDDDALGHELARILRGLADRLEAGAPAYVGADIVLRDANGNRAGLATLTEN